MNVSEKHVEVETTDLNRDPISGTPGSHPVGVGVGAAALGTAGAMAGVPFGPLGVLIGATVGTIAGAAAGKGVAESIDPTGEVEYWRTTVITRPYYNKSLDYERDYLPAYRYGWEARARYAGRDFESAKRDLESGWAAAKSGSSLGWDAALPAVRDAWDRSDRTYNAYGAVDRYYNDRYAKADYYDGQSKYDDYRPAYRYGTYARSHSPDGKWNDKVESDLAAGWDRFKGSSRLGWERAKGAVRDAWHGVERVLPGDFDRDGR